MLAGILHQRIGLISHAAVAQHNTLTTTLLPLANWPVKPYVAIPGPPSTPERPFYAGVGATGTTVPLVTATTRPRGAPVVSR